MKVKYKELTHKAVQPFKHFQEDMCYDVVATSFEELAPNIYKYGIGLAFEIVKPNTNCTVCIDLRPRSSIWKTGLVLSNCIGTIDELYRGEVSAVFYKVADGEIYKVGDRIGQICLTMTTPIEWERAEELSTTDRGSNGYGSTGR